VKHTNQLDFFDEEINQKDCTGEKKTCKICNKEQSIKNFYKSGVTITDSRCIFCSNLERSWRYKERPKFEHLNKGHCDSCGKKSNKPLHFDHDHSAWKFRGFLCPPCNLGIGLLGDNIQGLNKAIEYLNKQKEENV